jgi:hypothetical protein
MKIICACCGKKMGERDVEGLEGVFYTACMKCLTKIRSWEGKLSKLDNKPRSFRLLDDQSHSTERAERRGPDSGYQTQ